MAVILAIVTLLALNSTVKPVDYPQKATGSTFFSMVEPSGRVMR